MEDEEIVKLYWERNQAAVAAASEKYGGYCLSIARNILGSEEDAEECVNDVYLSAWNAIPPHRPKALAAFLGKLTRNQCFNRYKYRQAQKRGGGGATAVLDELADCVSGTDSVEEVLDKKELMDAINAYLGGLPEKKRNMFVCRYWYADSIASIAGRYKMTEGSAAMALSRLRSGLKAYLSERGYEL